MLSFACPQPYAQRSSCPIQSASIHPIVGCMHVSDPLPPKNNGTVCFSCNSSFSVCFFSRNSIFLSQQISRNSILAYFFSEANGAGPVTYYTCFNDMDNLSYYVCIFLILLLGHQRGLDVPGNSYRPQAELVQLWLVDIVSMMSFLV